MFISKNTIAAIALLYYSTNHVLAQGTATPSSAAPVVSTAPTFAIPNSKIAWKNQYPSGTSKPVPKPEWLTLVKDDPALKIPLNTLTPDGVIQNADPTGNNTYCNWTWNGCVKPTDIVSCADPKVWGTSFDDGPYEITRELLAYLKSIDRKVTFFVVGRQVITWPEILKEAYDQGHEIGIHTWDHSELTTISNDMVIGELKWTELAIKEVLGVTPRLMRPPRGDLDDRIRYIVHSLGYTPAMWSADSQDWRITAGGQTEAGVIANVTQWSINVATATRGGNSLMHDLNNVTVGADLKALPILHSKVLLTPVGVCAGWINASYQEQVQSTTTTNNNHASGGVVAPAASKTGRPSVAATSNSAAVYVSPLIYTIILVSFTAFIF